VSGEEDGSRSYVSGEEDAKSEQGRSYV
jgi:hypothetical protein